MKTDDTCCLNLLIIYKIFFTYAFSGVDIAQLLEYMNFSEKYVDLVRNSSAGNWAITYALYKLFTPLRYTVTVGMSILYTTFDSSVLILYTIFVKILI